MSSSIIWYMRVVFPTLRRPVNSMIWRLSTYLTISSNIFLFLPVNSGDTFPVFHQGLKLCNSIYSPMLLKFNFSYIILLLKDNSKPDFQAIQGRRRLLHRAFPIGVRPTGQPRLIRGAERIGESTLTQRSAGTVPGEKQERGRFT